MEVYVAPAEVNCKLNILVTGANGLVGRVLCSILDQSKDQVIRAVRTSTTPWEVPVGNLNENTQWDGVSTRGVDPVIHLSGKATLSNKEVGAEANQYPQINALGSANLARQCAKHGVKRFIYGSTVKVLGEGKGEPYRAEDLAVPDNAYAISKWESEQALWHIAQKTGMEVVILSSPLVYGPGAKDNFLRLMQAIDKRRPRPLAALQNRRSLIYLGNFVDAIRLCIAHTSAAGKAFLVSDDDDVSTTESIRRTAMALKRRPFLMPVPVAWMKWAEATLDKRAAVGRLVSSLAVDTAPLQQELLRPRSGIAGSG